MQFKEVNYRYSTVNVRWGVIRTKNLNDELDSATVVLSHIAPIDIEPYDLISLTNENNDDLEYWLVSDYTKTYVAYDTSRENPYIVDYTVNLMSCTKWLETVQLPNMAITNIGQNRTIKSYIERIVSRYVVPAIDYITDVSYNFDPRVLGVCPEMTFSQPTAREYLDTLVSSYGCIIQANYKGEGLLEITTLDLNETKSAIDVDHLKTITEMQTAEDYVTQLDHTLDNIIGQGTIIDYARLKSDGFVFNSEDAVAILSNKPYDISKVVLKTSLTIKRTVSYLNSVGATYTYNVSNIDLTNYFMPRQLYEALEIPSSFSDTHSFSYHYDDDTEDIIEDNNVKYKTNTIMWERGNNIISGFNHTETFKQFFGTQNTMTVLEQAVIVSYILDNFEKFDISDAPPGQQIAPNEIINESWKITDYQWDNIILEITYQPYLSARIQIEQKESFRHLVTMQDNSTNALTSIESYINQSIEKNSKLGNKSKLMTAINKVTNNNYTPIYEVGQYWIDEKNDKYILSKLEYEIKQNSIVYKGTLTKNYTNRNLNTIINREKRYYAFADSNSSVLRNEVFKTKVEISLVNDISSSHNTDLRMYLFLPADFLYFDITTSDSYPFGTLMAETMYGNNVASFTAKFQDNVIFGTEVGAQGNNGYKMKLKKYVDENGEFNRISFYFANIDGSIEDRHSSQIESLSRNQYTMGATYLSYIRNVQMLKDNRECIAITEVLTYFSNDSNIHVDRIAEITKYNNTADQCIRASIYNGARLIGAVSMTYDDFKHDRWVTWLYNLVGSITGTLVLNDVFEPDIIYVTVDNYTTSQYLYYDIISE